MMNITKEGFEASWEGLRALWKGLGASWEGLRAIWEAAAGGMEKAFPHTWWYNR